MALEVKIMKALSHHLVVERFGWENDGGISGFIVSPTFQNMPSLTRQQLIDEALSKGPDALNAEERRRVFLIAALTPIEFEYAGSRIRIQRVREMAGGVVEVVLDGGASDAEFVRSIFNTQKGVQTTPSKHLRLPGVAGTCMSFRAKGTEAVPLTKTKAIRLLKNDPYLEVMPNS